MKLPKDSYEIRLESIGGLGANLAGKILGETGALMLDLNASSFSSYGSEKRGSPVKGFIRYTKKEVPIRVNSPIEKPDILCLFHERLAGKDMVMAGVDENTTVIVNTNETPEVIRDRLEMYAGKICCVDALNIAMENKTRVNMVLLGAIAAVSEFITPDSIINIVKDTLGRKYPKTVEGNVNGIMAGYDTVKSKGIVEIAKDGKYPYLEYKEVEREWGYKNAPIGGINPIFGNSITNDLSSSREGYVPIFLKEECINCGLCDTTCPDMVFQFNEGEYKGKPAMVNLGPDYTHCKGCLRCVEVCPTDALTAGIEREVDISKTDVKNIELIQEPEHYDDVGANSWVNSESYTTNSLD